MFNQYQPEVQKKRKTRLDAFKECVGPARYTMYSELAAAQRNHLSGLPIEQINIFLDILNLEIAHEQQVLSAAQKTELNGLYQDIDKKYKSKLFDFMGKNSPIITLIHPNQDVASLTMEALSATLKLQRKNAKKRDHGALNPGNARRRLEFS